MRTTEKEIKCVLLVDGMLVDIDLFTVTEIKGFNNEPGIACISVEEYEASKIA